MQIHYWQRSLLLLQHPLFVLHHTMRYSCVVGWLGVIRIVTDVMKSDNTKNSHRINMESFPLSDETWQNYGPIDRWIEWHKCIFALKEVCENLAGRGVDEKGVFWRIGKEQANWVISWLTKMHRLFVERNEGSWVYGTKMRFNWKQDPSLFNNYSR